MSPIQNDDYELIAKHCPRCQSLIMAKKEKTPNGDIHYRDYKCSNCDWISPMSNKREVL